MKQCHSFAHAVAEFESLHTFTGSPVEFWNAFLSAVSGMAGVDAAFIILQDKNDTSQWKKLAPWPSSDKVRRILPHADDLAESCMRSGYHFQLLPKTEKYNTISYALAVRLGTESSEDVCMGVFQLPTSSELEAEEALLKLRLVAEAPALFQLRRTLRQAKGEVSAFASVLDLMVLLNEKTRFLASAMVLCNELASRMHCERVSLGWIEREYVRVKAISHTEKFEKKMEAIQYLEAAMEECFDQDEEILWPTREGSTSICRDHELFVKAQGSPYLCSIPLRIDGKVVAVVTCERYKEHFTEWDIRLARLACDMAVRRLSDLIKMDKWFGARWSHRAKEQLGKCIGIEHTWAKCLGLLIALGIGVLLFGTLTYRVEAPFILKTYDLAYIPAPFDGYVEEVFVEVGDVVTHNEVLISLDKEDLVLEEASATADQHRYIREAEKARADQELANMRIAQALAEQASSRLNLIQYRLNQADIIAPFSGIVVEGDLRERIGAPVGQGDVLFKIARIEKMYAQLEVSENDIHEIALSSKAELAFASKPGVKIPLFVDRIDPVAQTNDQGLFFTVRCTFDAERADWWRPGMSGVAKIEVGERNILWIFTHKTVDFLRMFFWW